MLSSAVELSAVVVSPSVVLWRWQAVVEWPWLTLPQLKALTDVVCFSRLHCRDAKCLVYICRAYARQWHSDNQGWSGWTHRWGPRDMQGRSQHQFQLLAITQNSIHMQWWKGTPDWSMWRSLFSFAFWFSLPVLISLIFSFFCILTFILQGKITQPNVNKTVPPSAKIQKEGIKDAFTQQLTDKPSTKPNDAVKGLL